MALNNRRTLRSQLIAAILAWMLLLSALIPRPAQAQFTGGIVFDPSNYVTNLQQLAQSLIHNKNELTIVYYLLSQYQYLIQDGHVNVNLIWSDLQPALDNAVKYLNQGNSDSIEEAKMITAFQQTFPQFSSNINYTDMIALYNNFERQTVVNTLQWAQAEEQANNERQTSTLNALKSVMANSSSKQDYLRAMTTMTYYMAQGQSQQTQIYLNFQAQTLQFMYAKYSEEQEQMDSGPKVMAGAILAGAGAPSGAPPSNGSGAPPSNGSGTPPSSGNAALHGAPTPAQLQRMINATRATMQSVQAHGITTLPRPPSPIPGLSAPPALALPPVKQP